mgnify:CR=1 FL=1
MTRRSNPPHIPGAGILARLRPPPPPKDDYANRCHAALAANPRWRCYRDLGHDG